MYSERNVIVCKTYLSTSSKGSWMPIILAIISPPCFLVLQPIHAPLRCKEDRSYPPWGGVMQLGVIGGDSELCNIVVYVSRLEETDVAFLVAKVC